MNSFSIDQEIRSDGSYRLLEEIVYFSKRYGKTVTCEAGMISDGATGAMDIVSRGWWVHDKVCNTGCFDDGTKLSNWQASQLLQDILRSEGRYWQSIRWFWPTFLFGGGKCRENGLITVDVGPEP